MARDRRPPTSAARSRESGHRLPREAMTRISQPKINLYRHGLRRAIERYLRDRYDKCLPVTASDCARYLGRTHSYLSRIAPDVLGIPLHDFLREQQLVRAAKLLRRFNLKVEEVALRSGFKSIQTFYRLFRERFGLPPGQYRQDKE